MQRKKLFGQAFLPLSFPMQNLSECDLISLIIGGKTNRSLFQPRDLAKRVLKHFDGLIGLKKAKVEEFLQIEGLGRERTYSLLASVELGWRLLNFNIPLGEPYLGSEQVFEAYRSRLGREEVEVVWVLLLDIRLRKVDALEVFRGALSGALIHPREILRLVLLHQAAAFILLHNHPSGDPKPSRSDFLITRKLKEASDLLQIDFLAFFIFKRRSFRFFAQPFLFSWGVLEIANAPAGTSLVTVAPAAINAPSPTSTGATN